MTPTFPAANPPLERADQSARTDEPFPDHHNDLAATLKFALQMIGRGVQDRRSAFHTPVLSTYSAAGPQARVLVLRAFDPASRTLTFHTDTRSAKLLELDSDPRVALTFYDAARKVQLRINGTCVVHVGDALAHQRWSASRPSSLRCFAGAPPGATSAVPTSGLPAQMEGREPELAELADVEPHFAVLVVCVEQLEWLHLHTRGQRRAAFAWAGGADQSSAGQNDGDGDGGGGGCTVCDMRWLNP